MSAASVLQTMRPSVSTLVTMVQRVLIWYLLPRKVRGGGARRGMVSILAMRSGADGCAAVGADRMVGRAEAPTATRSDRRWLMMRSASATSELTTSAAGTSESIKPAVWPV